MVRPQTCRRLLFHVVRLEVAATTTVTTYGSILYSSFTAIWLPVGMYRSGVQQPNRMEAQDTDIGTPDGEDHQGDGQPAANPPKALLDHTPLA